MELTIYPKPTKVRQKTPKNIGIHLGKASTNTIHTKRETASAESLRKLGVKAIFEVEENSDKKKVFSEEWWIDPFTEEKIIGNIWKKRFLVLTSTAVTFFSRKRDPPKSAFTSYGDTVTEQRLEACGKLGTFINLRDVSSVQELHGNTIHIVQASVTGKFSTLLRCSHPEETALVLQGLIAFKNSLESALQALNSGTFDLHPLARGTQETMVTCVIAKVSLVTRNDVDQVISTEGAIAFNQPFNFSFNATSQNLQFAVILAGFKQVVFDCSCSSVAQSVDFGELMIENESQRLQLEVCFSRRIATEEDTFKQARLRMLETFSEFDQSQRLKSMAKLLFMLAFFVTVNLFPDDFFTRTVVLLTFGGFVVVYYAGKYLVHSLRLELSALKQEKALSLLCFSCTPVRVNTTPNPALKPKRVDPIELLSHQSRIRKRLKSTAGGSFHFSRSQESSPRHRALSQYTSHDHDSGSEDSGCHDLGMQQLLEALQPQKIENDKLLAADVPSRWLEACKYNEKEALSRWRAALEWRQQNSIDTLLEKKQPKFKLIKAIFKQCAVGMDYKGNLVTIEFFGNAKVFKKLKDVGVTSKDFCLYCAFLTEYWIQHRLSSTGKLLKIIDLKGISLLSFTPITMAYLKDLGDMFKNYPECLESAYLINVPGSFRMVWKIISKFIDANTLDKFHILSGDLASLRSILEPRLDLTQHPKHYGGLLQLSRGFSELPFEKTLLEFVGKLNEDDSKESNDGSNSLHPSRIVGVQGSWKVVPERKKFKTTLFKQLCASSSSRAQLMSIFDHFSLVQNLTFSEDCFRMTSKIGPVKCSVSLPVFDSVEELEAHLDHTQVSKEPFMGSRFNGNHEACGASTTMSPKFLECDEHCLLLAFKGEHMQYIFHVGEMGTKTKKVVLSRYKEPMESQCIVLTCTKQG